MPMDDKKKKTAVIFGLFFFFSVIVISALSLPTRPHVYYFVYIE